MKNRAYKLKIGKLKMNLKLFWALSIFLIVGLVGLWLFQVQVLARQSGLLSESQARLSELSSVGKSPVFTAQVDELDKLAQNLGFEKINKVHYIRAVESTVLAK